MSLKVNNYISSLNFFLLILLGICYLGYGYLDLPEFMQPAGRMHPLLLHLPIGLWIGSLLLYFLFSDDQRIVKFFLNVTALSALISAIAGLFLSVEEGYNIDDLAWHRHTGTWFAFLAFIVSSSFLDNYRKVQIWIIGLASLLLVITGHLGAEITHGKNFLLPEVKGSKSRVACDENDGIYSSLVFPILEEKCLSCHNPKKSKGDFLMSDTLAFLKGGESGETIIDRNDAQKSYLLKVINLPSEAEMHMPPKGKKQLTIEEIQIIDSWIKTGASFSAKLNTLPVDHQLREICQSRKLTDERSHDFPAASAEVIDKINTDFLTVSPIAINSPALSAVFFVSSAYSSEAFAKLAEVKDQLVSLDLSYMNLIEKDWSRLAEFKRLEKLKLNSTSVTDNQLELLVLLPRLSVLSLHETAISEKLGDYLPQFPALQELYLGRTDIEPSTIQEWQRKHDQLDIHFLLPDDEVIPLSPPVLSFTTSPGEEGNRVILENVISGVTIRYTLDGTQPDSLSGMIYKEPISINKINELKAVAVKEGWKTSEVTQSLYFAAGFKPDSAYLHFPPNPRYPGEGVKTLIDHQSGDIKLLKDRTWIAFRQQPLLGDFIFQNGQIISSVLISYGIDVYNYLIPPTRLKVYGGKSEDDLELLFSMTSPPTQPEQKNDLYKTYIDINFEPKAYHIIRIEGHNLKKLPPWHRGAGSESWFHVDEIYFYE